MSDTTDAPAGAQDVEAAAKELAGTPLDKLARVHRKMQTRIQELTREFDAAVEAIKVQQAAVDMAIKNTMQEMGLKSVKTEHGTIILSENTRYYAQDWDAFRDFILENEALDLLEKRVAQRNMAQFLEDNPGKVPPGLNSSSEFKISVRKPTN